MLSSTTDGQWPCQALRRNGLPLVLPFGIIWFGIIWFGTAIGATPATTFQQLDTTTPIKVQSNLENRPMFIMHQLLAGSILYVWSILKYRLVDSYTPGFTRG